MGAAREGPELYCRMPLSPLLIVFAKRLPPLLSPLLVSATAEIKAKQNKTCSICERSILGRKRKSLAQEK
jgi:hypothetical protein